MPPGVDANDRPRGRGNVPANLGRALHDLAAKGDRGRRASVAVASVDTERSNQADAVASAPATHGWTE